MALALARWRTPQAVGRRKFCMGGCDYSHESGTNLTGYWKSREGTTALITPQRPESRLRPNRAALARALVV